MVQNLECVILNIALKYVDETDCCFFSHMFAVLPCTNCQLIGDILKLKADTTSGHKCIFFLFMKLCKSILANYLFSTNKKDSTQAPSSDSEIICVKLCCRDTWYFGVIADANLRTEMYSLGPRHTSNFGSQYYDKKILR